MSNRPPTGPVMLAATRMLKPPPIRVAKLGALSLPRAVLLTEALAVIGAGIVGAIVFSAILTSQGLFIGFPIGGIVGWLVTNFEPAPGRSLFAWLYMTGKGKADGLQYEDGVISRTVGLAPMPDTPRGKVVLVPGAVSVPRGSVDERGVPIGSPRDTPAHALPGLTGR